MDALEYRNGQNPLLKSGMVIGEISRVFPDSRFCEVRTSSIGDPHLVDRVIPQCQWLSLDAHPDGDESTSMPRAGSLGLVFFVAGEAFIWGFLKPTTRKKGASTGKEPSNINEGDKVLASAGGNRIVVKASGIIELYVGETLKTLYYPKGGIKSELFEELQARGDGGYEHWRVIDEGVNTTLHTKEFRQNMARLFILQEDKGFVDTSVIKKTTVGPGVPGATGVKTPVYVETVDILGAKTQKIGPEGVLTITSKPTGEWDLRNKLGGVNLSAKGDWKFNTPAAEVQLTATGDVDVKGPAAEAHLKAAGDIEVKNAAASFKSTPGGDIEVKNPAVTISAKANGDLEIKNPAVTMSASTAGDFEIKNTVGSVTMSKTGDLILKGPIGSLKIDKTGMIGLGGPTAELLDLLDQFLDAFINQPNLCMTPAGPSGPLNPPALANLVKIKALLATIKGSI